MPIARTTAGNLCLTEDSHGLRADADLDADDPDVELVARKRKAGNLSGQMSFSFRVAKGADGELMQKWNNDYTQRLIRGVDIHRGDVSIVTHGASSATHSTISERSVARSIAGRRKVATEIGGRISGLVEVRSVFIEMMGEPRALSLPNMTHHVKCRAVSGMARSL